MIVWGRNAQSSSQKGEKPGNMTERDIQLKIFRGKTSLILPPLSPVTQSPCVAFQWLEEATWPVSIETRGSTSELGRGGGWGEEEENDRILEFARKR